MISMFMVNIGFLTAYDDKNFSEKETGQQDFILGWFIMFKLRLVENQKMLHITAILFSVD